LVFGYAFCGELFRNWAQKFPLLRCV